MKRLVIYTTAFTLNIPADDGTVESVHQTYRAGGTISLMDLVSGESVLYTMRSENIAAIVVTDVND